jgi:hypothetical protein
MTAQQALVVVIDLLCASDGRLALDGWSGGFDKGRWPVRLSSSVTTNVHRAAERAADAALWFWVYGADRSLGAADAERIVDRPDLNRCDMGKGHVRQSHAPARAQIPAWAACSERRMPIMMKSFQPSG